MTINNLHVYWKNKASTAIGALNGGISNLEFSGRLLDWSICFLHNVSLPLRHIFNNVEGITTGPGVFLNQQKNIM